MKTFDIDACVPDYKSPWPTHGWVTTKGGKKKYVALESPSHRLYPGGWYSTSGKRPGVRPESMLDWRRLERRSHELRVAWDEARTRHWALMREIGALPKGTRKKLFCLPNDLVVKFEVRKDKDGGDTWSYGDKAHFLEKLIRNPDEEGKFILIEEAAGGAVIGAAMAKSDRMLQSMQVYQRTFRQAVQDRLRIFVESELMHRDAHHRLCEPACIVLTNEGRSYVLTVDTQGSISWHDGDVFSTGGTK